MGTLPNMSIKKGILQRLAEGPVIGDGGFLFELEKRGYITAGPFTPEVVVEHPEAVEQLHREFLRCGSDVMQAFTYYATEDKLTHRGQTLKDKHGAPIGVKEVNESATRIAKKVAAEGNALTLGSLSQTPSYLAGKPKAHVQNEFRKQVQVFAAADLDFVLAEYFEHIEEMEWAIEVCKESGKVVAATMCIGPEGDLHGVSAAECAIRMCKAGASLVGANCHFDPFVSLKTMANMKEGLKAAGLSPYIMCQPIGYLSPDAGKQGHIDLPEFPFALEPRIMTRFDAYRYAKEALELGVHYIGGCCGFQAYHIRAVTEAIREETGKGKYPEGCQKHLPWGGGLEKHTKPWVRARASKNYWEQLDPSTGRPFSRAMSKPDNWNLSQGSDHFKP